EHGHYLRQRRFGPSAQIERLDREPHRVDADHRSNSRVQVASSADALSGHTAQSPSAADALIGHISLIVTAPRRSSTSMPRSSLDAGTVGAIVTGTNSCRAVAAGASPLRLCSRHPCTT